MIQKLLQNISAEVQFFNTLDQKKAFFGLGAFTERIISLKKVSEVLGLEPEADLPNTVEDLV